MKEFRREFIQTRTRHDVAVHPSAMPYRGYDIYIVSNRLSNIPKVILSNFYNMLSFEHNALFVNVLIIIWLS